MLSLNAEMCKFYVFSQNNWPVNLVQSQFKALVNSYLELSGRSYFEDVVRFHWKLLLNTCLKSMILVADLELGWACWHVHPPF